MAHGSPTSNNPNDRDVRLAALRAAQKRQERRSRLLTIGAATLVVALIAVAGVIIAGQAHQKAAAQAAAEQPIDGVTVTTGLPANHVAGLPNPTSTGEGALPPVGGDHDPVPQKCGIYSRPIAASNAVHSLEHGAVWITYRPDVDAQQIDTLTALTRTEPYALLSPYPDLAAPVVLTAWGLQLEVDDATDPRVAAFVTKYAAGPQTPEPGEACTGGIGSPA